MINKEMFLSVKGKVVHVFTTGGGNYVGNVVECSDFLPNSMLHER